MLEEIAPDALGPRGDISDKSVPLRYLHDRSKQIGHLLSAEQVEGQVRFEAVLAHTNLGQDVAALIHAGSLRMVSIGFVPLDTQERLVPGLGKVLRRTEAEMIELSVVPVGAYQPHSRIESLHSADPDQVRREGARRRNAAKAAALGLDRGGKAMNQDLQRWLEDIELAQRGREQLLEQYRQATPAGRKVLAKVLPADILTEARQAG